jgi:hypothetical protein
MFLPFWRIFADVLCKLKMITTSQGSHQTSQLALGETVAESVPLHGVQELR